MVRPQVEITMSNSANHVTGMTFDTYSRVQIMVVLENAITSGIAQDLGGDSNSQTSAIAL